MGPECRLDLLKCLVLLVLVEGEIDKGRHQTACRGLCDEPFDLGQRTSRGYRDSPWPANMSENMLATWARVIVRSGRTKEKVRIHHFLLAERVLLRPEARRYEAVEDIAW